MLLVASPKVIEGTRIEALAQIDLADLPTEFPVFKMGDNKTSKGTFILDQAGVDQIMAEYKDHGVDMYVDYEHQTLQAAQNGKPAPAAAWLDPMPRADGLYATNVRWTKPAAKMLSNKEYRFTSPTFRVDKQNRIISLINIALTNLPATKNQQPLIAAKAELQTAQPEGQMANFATVVGLKEDAHEGEVEGRIQSLVGLERDLLAATGAENVGAAMAQVISAKSVAAENESLRKSLAEWSERAASEEADKKKKEFDTVMASCFEDGRVSRKDVDQIQLMSTLFEKHGIEALQACAFGLRKRPKPAYQAPAPANSEEAATKIVAAYAKENNLSFQDAYVKLSQERPALFQGGR